MVKRYIGSPAFLGGLLMYDTFVPNDERVLKNTHTQKNTSPLFSNILVAPDKGIA